MFTCISLELQVRTGSNLETRYRYRQSLFSGIDYWNGLLEWTTGMPFDLKFSHKNPIGVWDLVNLVELNLS